MFCNRARPNTAKHKARSHQQTQTHLSIPASPLRPAPSPACSCPPRKPHGNLHLVDRRSPSPCCCCCCQGANCPRRTRDGSLSLRPALLLLLLIPAADPLRPDNARGWRAPVPKKESAGDCIITAAATPTLLRARRPISDSGKVCTTAGTSLSLWYVFCWLCDIEANSTVIQSVQTAGLVPREGPPRAEQAVGGGPGSDRLEHSRWSLLVFSVSASTYLLVLSPGMYGLRRC